MLRLTRGISLADIARAHLPGASLCLVGSASPTRLLLACDSPAAAGGEARTQVHCYDLDTSRLTLLYTHTGRCKCVGASVDAQVGCCARPRPWLLTRTRRRPSCR